jgi:putative MATE family efflux protein
VFNFLAYATTGAVARHFGARNRRAAVEQGIEGLWLAALIGAALLLAGVVAAPFVIDAMGASRDVHPYAVTYLRVSIVGAPAMLVTFAATGFLRGWQDTRTTLLVAVGQNVLNLALELLLVYGADLGIAGSAWGTVLAQYSAAAVYLAVIVRLSRREHASARPGLEGMRASARIGGRLIVRTASLLFAFVTTTAIASRLGDAQVAAHQIAFQVFLFLALSLDALAIAGQAMIGRFLGAGDAEGARDVGRRLLRWGLVFGTLFGVGMLGLRPVLPHAFTHDPKVIHLAAFVLLFVALLQPLSSVVWVLDGVLIGAGDLRYLAYAMVAVAAVLGCGVALVLILDLGIGWLWASLAAMQVGRFLFLTARWRTTAWQRLGAEVPPTRDVWSTDL